MVCNKICPKMFIRNRKKLILAALGTKNVIKLEIIFQDFCHFSSFKFWHCYVFRTFQSKVNFSANILSHNAYVPFLFLESRCRYFKSQSIFIDRLGGFSEGSSA